MKWWLGAVLVVMATGCGDSSEPPAASPDAAEPAAMAEGCADVVAATADQAADGTWTFSVTVASADTGWDKYADLWEVRGPDGSVLGSRVLAHPHENEQPFTRSLAGVEIPDSVSEVVIAARDSVLDFCGSSLPVAIG